jgi:hypothetical protein
MASNPKWSYTGSSTGILYTDRRDFYLHPQQTAEYWGSISPFWTFTSKIGTEMTNDPDYKLFNHESQLVDSFKFYQDEASNGTLTAGTESADITIDDGTTNATIPYGMVDIGTLVEVRSSADVYKCTAVVTEVTQSGGYVTSMKYTPLWVNGTQSDADNDIIYIMGRAEEEGSTSPSAWADDLSVVWGSTQIQKTPLEITGTLLKMTQLRGYSNELARLRAEKYNEHNIGKNRSFLFGMRYPALTTAPTTLLTGANSRIIRTTWGIVSLLRRHGTAGTNTFARSYAAYDFDAFVDDMQEVYKYKNLQGTKYAFVGAGVLAYFSKINGGMMGNSSFTYQMNPEMVPTKFGFDVRTLRHPFGTLHLVYDPALRGQYNDTMVVIDPTDVKRIVFRTPMYQTSIQANDADLVKDQYFSDEGLGIAKIKTHSLFEFA